MILATGLTMSPGIDAGFPWLLNLFGGRQSALRVLTIFDGLIFTQFEVHFPFRFPRAVERTGSGTGNWIVGVASQAGAPTTYESRVR
jgi:hypothetical protein